MKKYSRIIVIILLAAFSAGCKSYSRFPLEPRGSVRVDTNLIGIWKMQEDTDVHNFFVIERYNDYTYAASYMNEGGDNRIYENWRVFMSEVNGVKFLNVPYDNFDWEKGESREKGWFFMKVTDIDKGGFNITLSPVTDSTLSRLTSSKEVHDRIATNLNNPAYFGKPVHFRKRLPLMYCK